MKTLQDLTHEIKNSGKLTIDGLFWIVEQNGKYLTNYNDIYTYFEEKYNEEIATYYIDIIQGFNECGIMLDFGSHDLILTENLIFRLEKYLTKQIVTGFLVCSDDDSIADIIENFEGKTLLELHKHCYENVLWKIGIINEEINKHCIFDMELGYVYRDVA